MSGKVASLLNSKETSRFPNQILTAFRSTGADNADAWVFAGYAYEAFGGYAEWEDPRSFFHGVLGARHEHIVHSRRVLMRLASVYGDAA